MALVRAAGSNPVTGAYGKQLDVAEKLGSPDAVLVPGGAEKEHLLQVIVSVGTFFSLNVPAERRAEVDALISELEKARDRASC